MVLLTLQGVVAGYGGGDVLQGIDLQVEDGSITCVVGPNGAGKSTVLRTISGLLRPRAGSIAFAGETISTSTCGAILAAGIVQVPQSQALFPSMSIRENIMMGGYLLRRNRTLLKQRYRNVEKLIPLVAERPNERTGNLSGGQRRMIELGRTLMLEPSLILMDEPSLGLDPKALKQVVDLIARVHREGCTILLVEQNVRLGFEIATHGVIMERGKVRLQGEPAALLNNPRMATLYLGGATEAEGSDDE